MQRTTAIPPIANVFLNRNEPSITLVLSLSYRKGNNQIIENIKSWADNPKVIKGNLQPSVTITFKNPANIIRVIERFFATRCHLSPTLKKQKKITSTLSRYSKELQSQIPKPPQQKILVINPTSATQNRILCNYLSHHSQFPTFQQGIAYPISIGTNVILTHSLMRKLRIDKNRAPKVSASGSRTFTYPIYLINEIIGKGSFKTVYGALGRIKPNKNTGILAYFPYPSMPSLNIGGKKNPSKVLTQTNLSIEKDTKEYLLNEHQILTELRDRKFSELTYENDFAYGLEDTADGIELFEFQEKMIASGFKPLPDLFIIAINLLEKLQDLHDKKIIHKDIKLENFYINEETYRITLLDFGFSKKEKNLHQAPLLCGTRGYVAPEILLQKTELYSYKIDIYALGQIFRFLFNEKNMLNEYDLDEQQYEKYIVSLYQQNTASQMELADEIKNQFFDPDDYHNFLNLLTRMCHGRPENRPETAEALVLAKAINEKVQAYPKPIPPIVIDPTKKLDNTDPVYEKIKIVYEYLLTNPVTIFHQNTEYKYGHVSFKFTHTLLLIKNNYYVVSINEKNIYILKYNANSATFTASGLLQPSTDHTKPSLTYTVPTIPIVVKKILLKYPNQVEPVINEYEIMRAVGYFNPKAITYEHNANQNKIAAYIVHDQIEGITLEQLINDLHSQINPLNLAIQLTIYINILKELDKLHQLGILHRRLKPSSIIVNPKTWEIRIIDFGDSIKTNQNTVKNYIDINAKDDNSLLYTAPEVIRNIKQDEEESDVYSAGMIGRHLFLDDEFVYHDMACDRTSLIQKKYNAQSDNNPTIFLDASVADQFGNQYKNVCHVLSRLTAHKSEKRSTLTNAIESLTEIKNDLEKNGMVATWHATSSASTANTSFNASNNTAPVLSNVNNQSESDSEVSDHSSDVETTYINPEMDNNDIDGETDTNPPSPVDELLASNQIDEAPPILPPVVSAPDANVSIVNVSGENISAASITVNPAPQLKSNTSRNNDNNKAIQIGFNIFTFICMSLTYMISLLFFPFINYSNNRNKFTEDKKEDSLKNKEDSKKIERTSSTNIFSGLNTVPSVGGNTVTESVSENIPRKPSTYIAVVDSVPQQGRRNSRGN